MRFRFGKHRGQHVSSVPTSYLRWALANLDALEPHEEASLKAEVQRRGQRFVPAAAVLADLEETIARRLDGERGLSHKAAALVGDVVLLAFEEIRRRHGVGAETELVVEGKRAATI